MINLQNLYNKSQTENVKLQAEDRSQSKTIRNLIIAVIILSITTVGPWVIKLLRMVKIIPV
jgi:hypothetical protein